jgi:hypothetical protein
MEVQLQIQEMPDFLAVRLTGPAKDAWHKFESIAEHCKHANKINCFLISLRLIETCLWPIDIT